MPLVKIKRKQARVRFALRGFRTKTGVLELFLKFELSLGRALSSDTLLEVAVLISNVALLRALIFKIESQMYSSQVFS